MHSNYVEQHTQYVMIEPNPVLPGLRNFKPRLRTLQCIDTCLHQGCPMPTYVESHPEKRKPGNRQNWDKHDWDNFIADRAAAADYETLTDAGLHFNILDVDAKEIYNDLLQHEQWYIGYPDGSPVLPQGPLAHMQAHRFSTYLHDRDDDRAKRSDPPYCNDNSLTYSAKRFKMKQTQTSSSAAKCRLIYNKHWHGRNRQKDNTLSEAERLETGKCILCQAPDSQEHTLHYCMDPTLTQLRREILTNLDTLVQEHDKTSNLDRQVGRAFLRVFDTTNEPGRFWIGNLSTTQIQEITNLINPDELSSLTQAQLNKIFLPLHRVLAEGCTSLMHHKLIREKHTQTPQQAQQSRIPPKTSIVTVLDSGFSDGKPFRKLGGVTNSKI